MVGTIKLNKETETCDVLDTACSELSERYGPLYVQTDGSMDMLYGTTPPTYYRVMHDHALPEPIEVKRFLRFGRRTITHGRRELFHIDLAREQIITRLEDEEIMQACDSAVKNPRSFEVRPWSWDK